MIGRLRVIETQRKARTTWTVSTLERVEASPHLTARKQHLDEYEPFDPCETLEAIGWLGGKTSGEYPSVQALRQPPVWYYVIRATLLRFTGGER